MATSPVPKPRTARSRRAILDATFDLVMQTGYPKLTMENVAARARVGKQTIYRWWPSKAALALEMLNDRIGTVAAFPDTGDITTDLTTQIAAVVGVLNSPLGGIYRGVIADAQSDPRVAEAIETTFLRPRADACVHRLTGAVAARQIRNDIPLETMVELIYGPLYYRLLVRGLPLTPQYAVATVRTTLTGLTRTPDTPNS